MMNYDQTRLIDFEDILRNEEIKKFSDEVEILFLKYDDLDSKNSIFSPTLSLYYTENEFILLKSQNELIEIIKKFTSKTEIINKHYKIYISDDKYDVSSINEILIPQINNYYLNSYQKINLDKDLDLRCKKTVEKLILSGSTNMDVEFFNSHLALDFLKIKFLKNKFYIHKPNENSEVYKLFQDLFKGYQTNGEDIDKIYYRMPSLAPFISAIKYCTSQFHTFTSNNPRKFYHTVFAPIGERRLETKENDSKEPIHAVYTMYFIYAPNGFLTYQIRLLNIYINQLLHSKKNNFRLKGHIELRKKLDFIKLKPLEYSQYSYSNALELFKEFCKEALRIILKSTKAHSATVRLYSQDSYNNKKGLELICLDCDSDASYNKGELKSISMSQKCVNTFTFSQSLNSQEDYITHLEKIYKDGKQHIPEKYKVLGLKQIKEARINTRSELCIAFTYNSIPLGTINLEAPVAYAFDDDCVDYILAVKNYIVDAYNLTIGYTNLDFLMNQVKVYATLHELDGYFKQNFFNKEQEEVLRSLLDFRSYAIANTENNIGRPCLKDTLFEWLEEKVGVHHPEYCNKLKSSIKLFLINKDRLNSTQYSAILFMLKNILENIINYSLINESGIFIKDRLLRDNEVEGRYIRIYSRFSKISDQVVLDRLGFCPILNNDRNEPRLGMVLVSIFTKLLGGVIFINRHPESKNTEIVIYIPYEPKEIML